MKYQPIQLEPHEADLLIEAIEVWPTLLGHCTGRDAREERERHNRIKDQLDQLRSKLLDHFGHRLTGPGKGAIHKTNSAFRVQDDYETLSHVEQPGNMPMLRENLYAVIANDQDLPTILVDVTPDPGMHVRDFTDWLCQTLNASPPPGLDEQPSDDQAAPAKPTLPTKQCPSCEGRGMRRSGARCNKCRGLGTIEQPSDDQEQP